ncbi:hypothetical protein FF38_00894 [Lucilia cuprina]|uniref:Uncharacterized protein n=1 Tax=Lucilia cuprina TaxID=7375 RepID=A0A0L0BZS4_LUCCU|nr:hypothetical protein FF38_00894 [Lucilia cuprina]
MAGDEAASKESSVSKISNLNTSPCKRKSLPRALGGQDLSNGRCCGCRKCFCRLCIWASLLALAEACKAAAAPNKLSTAAASSSASSSILKESVAVAAVGVEEAGDFTLERFSFFLAPLKGVEVPLCGDKVHDLRRAPPPTLPPPSLPILPFWCFCTLAVVVVILLVSALLTPYRENGGVGGKAANDDVTSFVVFNDFSNVNTSSGSPAAS